MSDASEGLTTSNLPDSTAANIGNQSQSPAATPPAPPAPAADPLGELPADRAVFDRGYVDSVRREAQRYRDEARTSAATAQTYTDVFGQYDDADRGVWLDLARTWATDPNRAAELMQQIAGNVLGESGATAGTTGPGDPATDEILERAGGEALTPEKIQELIDARFTAREAQQAEAKMIDEIYGEIRAAGFDPETTEGFGILYNANHFTNGNITEAIKMTQQYRQSIVDEYVQGRSSGRVAMPTSGNGVGATQTAEPIANLEDAKRATDAFLRERRNAS